jgi:hypothetical protein
LLAGVAGAAEDAAPAPEFLEFLGSWSADAADDELLDLLESLGEGAPEPPPDAPEPPPDAPEAEEPPDATP